MVSTVTDRPVLVNRPPSTAPVTSTTDRKIITVEIMGICWGEPVPVRRSRHDLLGRATPQCFVRHPTSSWSGRFVIRRPQRLRSTHRSQGTWFWHPAHERCAWRNQSRSTSVSNLSSSQRSSRSLGAAAISQLPKRRVPAGRREALHSLEFAGSTASDLHDW